MKVFLAGIVGVMLVARTLWAAPAADQAGIFAPPPGTAEHVVHLSALPDQDLIGQRVDVIFRRISNNSAVAPTMKVVLENVPLMEVAEPNDWGASPLRATLALSPVEEKKLKKYERVGYDLLLRARPAAE